MGGVVRSVGLIGPSGIHGTGLGCQKDHPRSICIELQFICIVCVVYVGAWFDMSAYGVAWFTGYGKDAEHKIQAACLCLAAWATFWSRSVNDTMFAKCSMYAIYVYTCNVYNANIGRQCTHCLRCVHCTHCVHSIQCIRCVQHIHCTNRIQWIQSMHVYIVQIVYNEYRVCMYTLCTLHTMWAK